MVCYYNSRLEWRSAIVIADLKGGLFLLVRVGLLSQVADLAAPLIYVTSILYIFIFTDSTFVGWARYRTQELYRIPCDINTPALHLKHVCTNHFQAVKSINIS